MQKQLALLTLLIPLSLLADTVSIASNNAYGQRHAGAYFFTYVGNVKVHSPLIGNLTATRLTAHISPAEPNGCDYLLARHVTIHHKTYILTCDNALFRPRTQRLAAWGNVTCRRTDAPAPFNTITSNADNAVLDCSSNQLYLSHGTHTHITARPSTQNSGRRGHRTPG